MPQTRKVAQVVEVVILYSIAKLISFLLETVEPCITIDHNLPSDMQCVPTGQKYMYTSFCPYCLPNSSLQAIGVFPTSFGKFIEIVDRRLKI